MIVAAPAARNESVLGCPSLRRRTVGANAASNDPRNEDVNRSEHEPAWPTRSAS